MFPEGRWFQYQAFETGDFVDDGAAASHCAWGPKKGPSTGGGLDTSVPMWAVGNAPLGPCTSNSKSGFGIQVWGDDNSETWMV